MTASDFTKQSQLEALMQRKTAINTAIQELNDYRAWRRKHSEWKEWERALRAAARDLRTSL